MAIPPSEGTAARGRPFEHRHHVRVSRRLIAWLVTLPLAVAGTQMAHAVAYRLTAPVDSEPAHDLSATGHGYVAYLPLALAIGAVLVAFALVAEVRHIATTSQGGTFRPRAWHFAVIAPALFASQEHFERLIHNGAFPASAVLEAPFIVGLLLQLPFALVAYSLARLLLHAAHSFGGLLAQRRQQLRAATIRWPAAAVVAPRRPALALGYGSRGPPLASR